jgi:integrase
VTGTVEPEKTGFCPARTLRHEGARVSPNLLRAVHNAAQRAGLVQEGQEPVGCHDLRHSLAANAFALGLSPTEVARLLRHANPRVTLTAYAGLTDDAVATLGEKMAALGGAS